MLMVEKAINTLKEQRYFDSIDALMGWDLWAGLSENGQDYRQEVSSYFAGAGLKLLKSDSTELLVTQLKEMNESDFSDDYERAAVKELIKRYTSAVQVPDELHIELMNFTSTAQKAWQNALKNNSFEEYKPYLKQLFELKLRVADAINPNANPFDVLCNDVDEGIDTVEVGRIFSALKTGVTEIVRQTQLRNPPDTSFLDVKYDKKLIRDMATEINALSGYDYKSGRDSETVHGMCTGIGPKDSRIAISYHDNWIDSVFSTLHEGGHGRYTYGSCQRAIDCGVWGGVSGAMHEGQARFLENMIGKAPEFWQCAYPIMQKYIPNVNKVSIDDFLKAINYVKPGLKRMSADELTYNLHPIIRFEIEQDYFSGKITTDDFEEVWNAKYKEAFGLSPKNVREGVLQDIHWSSGHIGYFQSYTLGNLYDGQMLHSMLNKYPNAYANMANGDFSQVNSWLNDNIYQYGQAYSPKQLIIKATGEPLTEKYYLDYLRKKFL